MGLVNNYMVKQALGKTNGQTLELEADPGQSFLVKNILIGGNDCLFADITVDKAMVGRFRTGTTLGSHLTFPYGMASAFDDAVGLVLKPRTTILEYLYEQDIFKGFPVAEGQKIVISPLTTGTKLNDIEIIYEEYDGGDINSEDENGSESTEYMIINYGDTGAGITASGSYHVNSQNSPSEFPAFPFGKVVPAKTEIELIGILASEVYDYTDGSNRTYTEHLKLVRERTVLFDDDRNGLMFLGRTAPTPDATTYYGCGNSLLGNYSDVDIKRPFMLPKPITFGPGEELNMYITAINAGSTAALVQADTEVGLIMKIRRVS